MPKNKRQTSMPKLTVELVPVTCWHSNLRDILSREQWDFLRNKIYKQNNWQCELCGGRGKDHPVECHEKWEYDDQNKIQKLTGLYSLCPACHDVKHIGLRNKGLETQLHIQKVNGWNEQQTNDHISQAWNMWFERNQFEWNLDIAWLKQFGINVVPKRDVNNKICSDLSTIDIGTESIKIESFPNMNTFGNFYRDIREHGQFNSFLDNISHGNIILLAINISSFHWVLVKIAKENECCMADYYDPKGKYMPKDLLAILEDLLQEKIHVSMVATKISMQAQNDGSWLSSAIQEIISRCTNYSVPPIGIKHQKKSSDREKITADFLIRER